MGPHLRHDEQDLRTVISTFQAVYPDTTVWQDHYLRDIFLVGMQQALEIDFARLKETRGSAAEMLEVGEPITREQKSLHSGALLRFCILR